LRIGQPADLYVDMYGTRRVFKGRVTGFTMGTGSTLAILPAENATGNFVKVVQRLPVRIDLTEPNPDDTPLFVGLSVTPYVYFKEKPTGPDGGNFLQPYFPNLPTDPTRLPPPTLHTNPPEMSAPPASNPTAAPVPATTPSTAAPQPAGADNGTSLAPGKAKS
jgi:membrane fusion protein (multidrug efflux system)